MRILVPLCAIGLWAGVAFAQNSPSSISRTLNLPAIGVASPETVQVNVTYLSPGPGVTSSVKNDASTASCAGSVAFYDVSGAAIGTSTSFTVTAGQIFVATLPYSGISGATAPRTTIRAAVTTTGAAPCPVSTNIETFDTATGVTHVHVDGPSEGVFANLHIGFPTR